MKCYYYLSILLLGLVLATGCADDIAEPGLKVLAIQLNDTPLTDDRVDVPLNSTLTVVLSAGVDPQAFEGAFSVSPAPSQMTFRYLNQATKITVDLLLSANTTYTVNVGAGVAGADGRRLETPVSRSFSTGDSGGAEIACSTASDECVRTLAVGTFGSVEYYASFPLKDAADPNEDITSAVIVIHGANRDADNYFTYLSSTLAATGLESSTALLAPRFSEEAEASGDELYWASNSWRQGNNSAGPGAVGAFAVVDSLIAKLVESGRFPNLERIVVTGHSSGALFTQLYAAANDREDRYPELEFSYLPANSQYYYYADDRRVDESTGELYTPTNCTGYNSFPAGYAVLPPYLMTTPKEQFDRQFVTRSVIYILGNGTGPDPTLNTSDCAATLLGSSRYQRGENLYRYLEEVFPGEHQHERLVVEGIGHDGQAIYVSDAFRNLLEQLLK